MRFAFLLTLLFLCSCRSTETYSFPASRKFVEALPDSFTLVVWNVQKAIQDSFTAEYFEVFRRSDADLLLVQEANLYVQEFTALPGVFAASWTYPWPGGSAVGLISAARVLPSSVERFPSWWREFLVTAPKLSIATTYPFADGRELLVVNSHLLAFERWGTIAYRSQVEGLRSVLSEHSGPMIWAGDFNSCRDDRLEAVLRLAADVGLTDVDSFVDRRSTSDKGAAFFNWLLGVDASIEIDRVFVRGFDVLEAKVLPGEGSDHLALEVRLRLSSSSTVVGSE